MRETSEANRLENLMNLVALESIRLLTLTLSTNASTEAFLQLPPRIGDKQYWLKLENDSSRAWIEGGFGNSPSESGKLRVSIIKAVLATGSYVSGYGAARLSCFFDVGVVQIQLSSDGEQV
jgi:hypothetical protein